MDEAITYQELDSIDNPSLYSEDDVVEVFIRANSGGTKWANQTCSSRYLMRPGMWQIRRWKTCLNQLNKATGSGLTATLF